MLRLAAVLATMAILAVPAAAHAAAPCAIEINAAIEIKEPKIAGNIGDLIIDDACKYVYVANAKLNRVEVFNLWNRAFEPPIAAGLHPSGLDLSADGKTLYVVNNGEPSTGRGSALSVIDLAQRQETRQVALPGVLNASRQMSVAAAANGLVLVDVYGGNNKLVYQYNPTTGAMTERTDFPDLPNSAQVQIRSSADHSVIGVAAIGGPGPVYRYESASNTVTARKDLTVYATNLSVSGDGSLFIVGGRVLDSTLTQIADLGGFTAFGLNADGSIAYRAGYGFALFNPRTAAFIRSLGFLHAETGPTSISRDGRLVVQRATLGFALVPFQAQTLTPSLRTTVFSSSQTANQSFLRFYNANTTPMAVTVVLSDSLSGVPLVTWTSPNIPAGAAPQYAVAEIEAAATGPFVKPPLYVAEIQSGAMLGTFANVLWRAADGTLTNLSTCDTGVAAITYRVANVHSRRIQAGYPSSIVVTNTGVTATSATLAVSDAATGARLGAFTTPAVPGHGAQTFTVDVIEAGARIPLNATAYHYVITLEGPFNGHLQHLVDNQQAGVLTDMSTVCVLAGPP